MVETINNPLWAFACRVYAAGAVRTVCLALQDSFDIDVDLILWASWAATRGIALTPQEMAEARTRVAAWRDEVVRPLRYARRAMKTSLLHASATVADLRSDLQTLELRAEQIELAILFEWTNGRWTAQRPGALDDATLAGNLASVIEGAGVPDGDHQVLTLSFRNAIAAG